MGVDCAATPRAFALEPNAGGRRMGYMEVVIGRFNQSFGDPVFLQQHREELMGLYGPTAGSAGEVTDLARSTSRMLGEGGPLGTAVQGIDPQEITRILGRLSPIITEASRAVIYGNLQRKEPYGMTFAWRPGYDNELTVWESSSAGDSPGWITVVIKSRHPADPNPISG
jgi:hypothetical protein